MGVTFSITASISSPHVRQQRGSLSINHHRMNRLAFPLHHPQCRNAPRKLPAALPLRPGTRSVHMNRCRLTPQIDPQKLRLTRRRLAHPNPNRSPPHSQKQPQNNRCQRTNSAKNRDARQQAVSLLHLRMKLQRHLLVPRQLNRQPMPVK